MNNDDPTYNFWKAYDEADTFDKAEKLKSVVEGVEECLSIEDVAIRKRCLANIIKTYIDDALDYAKQAYKK